MNIFSMFVAQTRQHAKEEHFLFQNQQLTLLTEKGMGDAVKEFVDKDETAAIAELVKYQLNKTQTHLKQRNTTDDRIEEEVIKYKEHRQKKRGEEDEEVQEALKIARESSSVRINDDDDDDFGADSDDAASTSTTGSRGRGRGRGGRGARGGGGRGSREGGGRGARGGGRGRGKAPVIIDDDARRSQSSVRGSTSSRGWSTSG